MKTRIYAAPAVKGLNSADKLAIAGDWRGILVHAFMYVINLLFNMLEN